MSIELEFPSILEATERASAEAQKSFFRVTGGSFAVLALASMVSLFPVTGMIATVTSIIGVLFFLLVILIQVSNVKGSQEQKWYEARAASESIKTAAWEFSVGGEAYRIGDEEAEERFRNSLREILSELRTLDVGSDGAKLSAVTPSMLTLRKSNRSLRESVYLEQRVQDQVAWYSKKAKFNKRKQRCFYILVILVEAIAVIFGLLRIAGMIEVDLLSPIAAIAAGLIGWMQAKNYSNLSAAYAVTSHEVAMVPKTLSAESSEEVWAQAVHDAEAAFSREHTMWLARRQGPV